MTPELAAALVEEATRKAGLVWIGIGDEPRQPVWHVWHEGAAYVLSGPGEQPDPGLAEVAEVSVAVPSKDKGSRLVVWVAAVEPVPAGSTGWAEAVAAIQPKRLNLPDGEAAVTRWAATCRLFRLVPIGRVLETSTDPDSSSGAAPPPPTAAASAVRRPFHLGGRD